MFGRGHEWGSQLVSQIPSAQFTASFPTISAFASWSRELGHLLPGLIEEAGDMPARDQQQVAGADRVPVPPGVPEPALQYNLLSCQPAAG